MTTPAKPSPAKKVADGKIDHDPCYAAKLHPATSAGRSLCRAVRSEGKPLTRAGFLAMVKKQAAARGRAKPAPADDPRDAVA